jgi:site-specific recombinase XerD
MSFKSVFNNELQRYLQLRKKSCSKSCYDHDLSTLRSFDNYLHSNGCTYKKVSEEQIIGWIKTLNGKSITIAGNTVILRNFLKFISAEGIQSFIPVIPKVRSDYAPYVFSDKELDTIFELADGLTKVSAKTNNLINYEMPMILRLMYGCGLRIGETLGIRMGDINFYNGCLTLRNTKRNKERLVPMHESLTEILKNYCYAICVIGKPEAFLFPKNETGIPLTVKSARYKFDSILEKADITLPGRKYHERGPCLHCLRHVFAHKSFSQIEETGVNINEGVPYLSIYLGHDSLFETEKYLKFSSESFPNEMDKFDNFSASLWPEVQYEE